MTPPERADDSLPDVAPVDLSERRLTEFSEDGLDLPYYLAHLHRVANAVRDSGDHRGFIDVPVWRRVRDNEPYNARIMESCLTLAYFYATDRPWNSYYGDPDLRECLEAALEFWVSLQNDDGRFSEYGVEQWNLAATAFATKFIGEALVRLDGEGTPPIDPALHDRVIDAHRRAIRVVLTDDELRDHGMSYSNQFSNVWAGAGAHLAIRDDPELADLFAETLEATRDDLQSPAGYFYESDGPDWNYSLSTHHTNLKMAYHYLRDTDLASTVVDKERRWAEWMAYGAVLEPDAAESSDGADAEIGDRGFVLNRGGDTRRIRRMVDRHETPLSEHVPRSRSFAPTNAEREDWQARRYDSREDTWPVVEDLDSMTPYAFLHRHHVSWYPDADERRAARADLPYLAEERFVHQRADGRTGFAATYVRRPTYYAAFNAAPEANGHQRFGLGLLWHPEAGAAVQTGAGRRGAAFGTRPGASDPVYEADGLDVTYDLDGRTVEPAPGGRDLDGGEEGDLGVAYPLADAGRKTYAFGEDAVEIGVTHAGGFVETVPLLGNATDAAVADDGIEVEYGSHRLVLDAEGSESLSVFDTGLSLELSPSSPGGRSEVETNPSTGKDILVARLHASDDLTYRLGFESC